MVKVNAGAAYYETSHDSYFKIFKDYYPSGNIKYKGIALNVWNNFKKGIWYEFDENGNLIKEINYDKPYKLTFEDVLKFCEEKGIKIDIQAGTMRFQEKYRMISQYGKSSI